jgi:hypothetical protein
VGHAPAQVTTFLEIVIVSNPLPIEGAADAPRNAGNKAAKSGPILMRDMSDCATRSALNPCGSRERRLTSPFRAISTREAEKACVGASGEAALDL